MPEGGGRPENQPLNKPKQEGQYPSGQGRKKLDISMLPPEVQNLPMHNAPLEAASPVVPEVKGSPVSQRKPEEPEIKNYPSGQGRVRLDMVDETRKKHVQAELDKLKKQP